MATTTAKKSTAKSTATPARNRRRPAKGGTGAELTDEQNAESGFTASKELGESLQKVLVDLIELSLQGKQAHWNVVGRNFRDTHLQLDEIIEAAREFSDTVAERMRSLHALPDGRSDTVAETTTLPEFPQGEIATGDVIDLVYALQRVILHADLLSLIDPGQTFYKEIYGGESLFCRDAHTLIHVLHVLRGNVTADAPGLIVIFDEAN